MLTTKHPTKQEKFCICSKNLEGLGNTLLNWFNNNSMKANPGKYHLLLSSNDSRKITIGNKKISSHKFKKLLGIKIDNNLNYKEHIISLCKKASQKNNAFSRLALSMNFEQRRLAMNSFISCYFSYCLVV